MDPIGDDNNDITPSPSDTQPIDSQSSPSDGETDVEEDGNETQVVDIAGETQVLDFGADTQVIDDWNDDENVGDTQLVEDCFDTQLVEDCFDTQVVSDTDCDSDGTEVLSDGDKGDFARSRSGCLSNEQTAISKHGDASTDEKHSRGSAKFTFIRAQSLRASGLAARNRALQAAGKKSPPIVNRDKLPEQVTTTSSTDYASDEEEQNSTGRIGGSTVRKLFMEDELDENEKNSYDSETNVDGEDILPFPDCDNELAGLSYVDSQEPGDLSQAHALEFVEKLCKSSFLEFDDELDHKVSTGGKSKPLSFTKGIQELAMKANRSSTVGEMDIYDFDDAKEDEGGGEFFVRKKEEILSSGKTLKPIGSKLVRSTNNEKKPNANKKTIFHSDSKLLLQKSNTTEKAVQEPKIVKNLAKNFDEQAHPKFPDVGFNTQQAADALELLCNRDEAPLEKSHTAKEDSGISLRQSSRQKRVCLSVEGTRRSEKKPKRNDAELPKEPPVTKKRSRSLKEDHDREVIVTRSKGGKSNAGEDDTNHGSDNKVKAIKNRKAEITLKRKQLGESPVTKKHSRSLKKDHDREAIVTRSKRGKSNAGEDDTNDGSDDKVKASKNRKAEIALKRKQLGESRLSCGLSESDTGDSAKKLQSPEKVGGSAPVARQTRKSARTGTVLEKSTSKTNSSAEEKLLPEKSGVSAPNPATRQSKRKRQLDVEQSKTTKPDFEASKLLNAENTSSKLESVQCKKSEHVKSDQQSTLGDSTCPVSFPRGKRSRRNKDKMGKSAASPSSSTKNVKGSLDISPAAKFKPLSAICTPPSNCSTPVNAASPICMGDEYLKHSCKRNLSNASLMREVSRLNTTEKKSMSQLKDSRKRRDMGSVYVLFSQHLDDDIVKQQKKILIRAGGFVVSSILDATHFVTDSFQPLLVGRRVLVTPNTKPGVDTISSLVKAVGGQAMERTVRSTFKDVKLLDDLLILSCEEDYAMCEPLLENGAAVYSSELLLNGIVTQKLDYARYRLFVDNVKRTRSTIFLRKANDKFLRVTKLT
ncbi:hypothetical protein ACFE04_016120 [Oxalis oulophora]